MEVRVDVNENDIVRVEIGDTTNIDVDAYNTFDKMFKGVVTEIASTANPKPSPDAVTEFKVKIRVINESFRDLVEEEGIKNPFKPGMTASVEIITQEKDNILLVPISSVTTKTEKDSLGNEKINQVLFMTTTTEVSVGTSSYTDSGLTQAITPSASDSRVLIMGMIAGQLINGGVDKSYDAKILRDTTEIETEIIQIINDNNAKSMADMGKIMAEVMKRGKGLIDGKSAQKFVKELIG